MKESLLKRLFESRLMTTDEEFETFDSTLDELCDIVKEDDIRALVNILDDNTTEFEVMFRVIHVYESLLKSKFSYEQLILGINDIIAISPEWSRIILYRILNHEYSRIMLKNNFMEFDKNAVNNISQLMIEISLQDPIHFQKKVAEVLVK